MITIPLFPIITDTTNYYNFQSSFAINLKYFLKRNPPYFRTQNEIRFKLSKKIHFSNYLKKMLDK